MFNKIRLKTDAEIELIRKSSLLVGKTLAEVGKHIIPGIATEQLDHIAEEFILDHKAIPVFQAPFYPISAWPQTRRDRL